MHTAEHFLNATHALMADISNKFPGQDASFIYKDLNSRVVLAYYKLSITPGPFDSRPKCAIIKVFSKPHLPSESSTYRMKALQKT